MKKQISTLGLSLVIVGQVLAQTCTDFIDQGRAALGQGNMTNACLSFSNAVVLCPNDPTANTFYAATRLLYLVSKPPVDGFLTRLGVTATNRNIYDWQATVPEDAYGDYVPPAGVNAKEGATLFRTNVLPEITAAITNLSKVTNSTFLLDLTSSETAGAAVTLDYGDVLLLRALLHTTEYLGYTINSWNLDAQLTAIKALYNATNDQFNVQRLLANNPQLFTFATTVDLSLARRAFTNAVDAYFQASAFIRKRPLNVTRLFNWDPNLAEGEYQFRMMLTDLKAAVQGPVALRLATNYTVNLTKHFDGSKSPRAMFPAFTNNMFIEGTLPDSTFGGVVQGVTRHQAEEGLANILPIKSPDVRLFGAAKSQNFFQSGTNTPIIRTNSPYTAIALVIPDVPDWYYPWNETTVTNVTLRWPGNSFPNDLLYSWEDMRWELLGEYEDKASLDADAPSGAYEMVIATRNDGTRTLTLNLPADAYPNTPRLSNYAAAQQINPHQDFGFTWDAFVGGTTNDYVQFGITDRYGQEIFKSPEPWEDGALTGLSTSIRIPADVLQNGPLFEGWLTFAKASTVDRTTFPGGIGFVGYVKKTEFNLRTVDVVQYEVEKGQNFIQTNAGAPVLISESPFSFQAKVEKGNQNSSFYPSLRLPNEEFERGMWAHYTYNYYPYNYYIDYYYISQSFESLTNLDYSYPDGTYQYTFEIMDHGRRTNSLSLTGGVYPSTPRISNFTAAQTIDGTQDFTLTWAAFTGGTVNDYIGVSLWAQTQSPAPYGGETNRLIISTPELGKPGALNGTATSLVIPAFSLKLGETVHGKLIFGKVAQRDTNSYPGAIGLAGYYKTTEFQIHATNGLPAADLAATTLNFSGNYAANAPNQTVQVDYKVVNQGNKKFTLPRAYHLYRSTNPIFSRWDSEWLDSYWVYDALPGGSADELSRSVPFSYISSGDYYLHLVVEPYSYYMEEQESDLNNNQLSILVPVVQDTKPPISKVLPLPGYVQPEFTVSWQGADEAGGSGIQEYDIYVSDNGAPAVFWLTTPDTSASYLGEVDHTYSFYSRARDHAGNWEGAPLSGRDTTTTVSTNTFSLTFNLAKGYNLLALPFSGTGLTDAEQLAGSITNCAGVWNWDAATQKWSGHPKGGGNNFALTNGSAYLISVTGDSSFSPSGLWAAPVFAIKRGYNLVSLPNSKPGITTAEQLAVSIPNCTAVWNWDAATQKWSGHPKGAGNDFSVEVGRAYLIFVTADGSW